MGIRFHRATGRNIVIRFKKRAGKASGWRPDKGASKKDLYSSVHPGCCPWCALVFNSGEVDLCLPLRRTAETIAHKLAAGHRNEMMRWWKVREGGRESFEYTCCWFIIIWSLTTCSSSPAILFPQTPPPRCPWPYCLISLILCFTICLISPPFPIVSSAPTHPHPPVLPSPLLPSDLFFVCCVWRCLCA